MKNKQKYVKIDEISRKSGGAANGEKKKKTFPGMAVYDGGYYIRYGTN